MKEKEVIAMQLQIEKLCSGLILGARRGKGKGWYRKVLGLGNGQYFLEQENSQFHTKLLISQQHIERAFCLSKTSQKS